MSQTRDKWTKESLLGLREEFEEKGPQDILAWALGEFHPQIALATGFGAEGMVLVDMAVRIEPHLRVFYLDTEFLFPETYELRDRIIEKYGVRPVAYRSALSPGAQAIEYGPELYKRNPDLCCHLRKVLPLRQALSGLEAWITGIRRDQTSSRAKAGVVEWDEKFGLVKVNPLARWSSADVWNYLRAHDVPYNPLHDRGYPSVGCTHCTSPVQPSEDLRAGRWRGFAKTECGLHQ